MCRETGPRVHELPPLPNPYQAGDGWDWIDALTGGWAAAGVWGCDGWNLGSWPLVIIAVCRIDTSNGAVWGVCTYVEGDLDVTAHLTRDAMIQAVDQIAEFYWRHLEHGPKDLPPKQGLMDHHRGPCNL